MNRDFSASRDAALDDLVTRAAAALRAPVAVLSTIDAEALPRAVFGTNLRVWEAVASPYLTPGPLVQCISDLSADPRWARHSSCIELAALRSVAMVGLLNARRMQIGVLAVYDAEPREYSQRDCAALINLSDLIAARLGARAPGAPQAPRVSAVAPPVPAAAAPANGALQRERALFDAAISSLPGAFYMFTATGKMLRWNNNFMQASGYSSAEVGERLALDFIAEPDRKRVAAAIGKVFAENQEVSLEANMLHRSGAVAPYLFSGRPLVFEGETLLVGLGRDVGEKKRAEQQLRQAKERLDLALSSSRLALWDWDLVTRTVYFNEGWSRIVGAPIREAIFSADEVQAWTHPEDQALAASAMSEAIEGSSAFFAAEYRIRDESGAWIWIASRGTVTQRDASGEAVRMTGTSQNITSRKEADERVEFLATRDPLTGLPNRALFNDRLEQAIASAARSSKPLAFMFIDLDRFKTINDSLGHHVGDQLLKQVAARLSSCVRATDTVARLGGDEFAVILEDLQDQRGAEQVAQNMIASLASPIFTESSQLNTSCSIGIGIFPNDGRDSATLMKNADAAMYHAKEKGRNNFQFFSADMNAQVLERLSVENYLRQALRREELVVHYQPRLSFATGAMEGVEALLRWQHPRHGLVPPDRFISVAEDSGLIVPIGAWVLREACGQVRQWQNAGLPALKVSVNLSVGQMRDGAALKLAISKALLASRLNPRFLELELTETLLMQHTDEKIALLTEIGKQGIGLSIDDFGTGYSSLYYLKILPVDSVKIDGSFVRDIVEDPNDEAIIRAIVAMSHSMQLKVVAEAVETAAQFTTLKHLGCDQYQGYFFSQPLSVEEFEARFLGDNL